MSRGIRTRESALPRPKTVHAFGIDRVCFYGRPSTSHFLPCLLFFRPPSHKNMLTNYRLFPAIRLRVYPCIATNVPDIKNKMLVIALIGQTNFVLWLYGRL
jgi:hypothetical protein